MARVAEARDLTECTFFDRKTIRQTRINERKILVRVRAVQNPARIDVRHHFGIVVENYAADICSTDRAIRHEAVRPLAEERRALVQNEQIAHETGQLRVNREQV